MKTLILLLCILGSVAVAQQTLPLTLEPVAPRSDAGRVLPENYVLTLSITNKDQMPTMMSLVVATTEFSTHFTDSKWNLVNFSGTLSAENGSVLVRYTLSSDMVIPMGTPAPGGTMVPESREVSTEASARIRPGEWVEIHRSNTRIYRLSIRRLGDEPSLPRAPRER